MAARWCSATCTSARRVNRLCMSWGNIASVMGTDMKLLLPRTRKWWNINHMMIIDVDHRPQWQILFYIRWGISVLSSQRHRCKRREGAQKNYLGVMSQQKVAVCCQSKWNPVDACRCCALGVSLNLPKGIINIDSLTCNISSIIDPAYAHLEITIR